MLCSREELAESIINTCADQHLKLTEKCRSELNEVLHAPAVERVFLDAFSSANETPWLAPESCCFLQKHIATGTARLRNRVRTHLAMLDESCELFRKSSVPCVTPYDDLCDFFSPRKAAVDEQADAYVRHVRSPIVVNCVIPLMEAAPKLECHLCGQPPQTYWGTIDFGRTIARPVGACDCKIPLACYDCLLRNIIHKVDASESALHYVNPMVKCPFCNKYCNVPSVTPCTRVLVVSFGEVLEARERSAKKRALNK